MGSAGAPSFFSARHGASAKKPASLSHPRGPPGPIFHLTQLLSTFPGVTWHRYGKQGAEDFYLQVPEQKTTCPCLTVACNKTTLQGIICGGKGQAGGGQVTVEKQGGPSGRSDDSRQAEGMVTGPRSAGRNSQKGLTGRQAEGCQGKLKSRQVARGRLRTEVQTLGLGTMKDARMGGCAGRGGGQSVGRRHEQAT